MPTNVIIFFSAFVTFFGALTIIAEVCLMRLPTEAEQRAMNLRNAMRRVRVMHNMPYHIAESFHGYLSSYGTEYGWAWLPHEVDRIWAEFAGINRAELRKWNEYQRKDEQREQQEEKQEGALRPGTPYVKFDVKNKIAEL